MKAQPLVPVNHTCAITNQIRAKLAEHYKNNLFRSRLKFIKSQQIKQKDKLNFSSNDYLGFANNPVIIKKVQELLPTIGTGSGASNIISGYHHIHQDLELLIAELLQCEKVILFSSGYMANLAISDVLLKLDNNTIAIHDHNNHASLLDGSRLAHCKLTRFNHNNLDHLKKILQKHSTYTNKIIFTESLFSMDGDFADLENIKTLSANNNAVLVVDNSHAFGLYDSHLQRQAKPELIMGTFGKAIGSAGAFVGGSKILIEALIQFARPYIYTTSLSPIAAAASLYAIKLNQSDTNYREQLFDNISYFKKKFQPTKLNELNELYKTTSNIVNSNYSLLSPIQPIILGSSLNCIKASEYLLQNNIITTAIRAPTVPTNKARLRITLSAQHTKNDIDFLIQKLIGLESILI